jgi:hypothetical protein
MTDEITDIALFFVLASYEKTKQARKRVRLWSVNASVWKAGRCKQVLLDQVPIQ